MSAQSIAIQKEEAVQTVKRWLDFMVSRNLDHYAFKVRAPIRGGVLHDDNFGVLLGIYCDEFARQGFTLISHDTWGEQDPVMKEGNGFRKYDPEKDEGKDPDAFVNFTCGSVLVRRSPLIRPFTS